MKYWTFLNDWFVDLYVRKWEILRKIYKARVFLHVSILDAKRGRIDTETNFSRGDNLQNKYLEIILVSVEAELSWKHPRSN